MISRIERELLGGFGTALATRPARIVALVVAVLLAGFLSYKAVTNQITETSVLSEDRVSLSRYVDGTAARPFAYRYLTPVLVRFAKDTLQIPALLRMMPDAVQEKAAFLCTKSVAQPVASCDEVVSYAVVAYGTFFCFLLTIYAISNRLFGNVLISLSSLFFSFLLVNSILLLGLSHAYDFTVLMVVSLILLCLERGWTILSVIAIGLGFVAKETIIIYPLAFFFVNLGRLPLLKNVAYFCGTIALFILVHGAIRLHFSDNIGAGHEYYLPLQIYFFTEHITLSILLFMVLSLIVVFYRFPRKAQFLRRASIVILPWFVLYLLFGVQRELRVMVEILPLVVLLVTDSVSRLILGDSIAARPAIEA